MSRSPMVVSAVCLSAGMIAAAAIISRAGPLDPPGGPIAPSYKTLAEVEPRIAVNSTNTPGDSSTTYKIVSSGSYYLTGNVTAPPGRSGIVISGQHVTLDLNGFKVFGSIGSTQGITCTSASAQVTIKNGTVANWLGSGIDLVSAGSSRCESVAVLSNGGNGIRVGTYSIVHLCIAQNNGGSGITVDEDSLIESCTSEGNGNYGIQTTRSVVSACSANLNSTGISGGDQSHIGRCTVIANKTDGIVVSALCTVADNTCSGNGNSAGDYANIHVLSLRNRIENNSVAAADRGIRVDGSENILIHNTASGNFAANYTIASGNYGLFITATPISSFSGSTGGTALGTFDPYANFSY